MKLRTSPRTCRRRTRAIAIGGIGSSRSAEPRERFVEDFLGPEHDTVAGAADRDHEARACRSYVICSTPRSGSGLLFRGLAGTGKLGVPLEYFNPLTREPLTARWRCGPGLDPYVDALHARRCTPEGLLGVKVHWDQLPRIRVEARAGTGDDRSYETADSVIERLFPAPRFIRIVRQDLDSQAVSYWRALRSRVWSISATDADTRATAAPCPPGEDTPYSYEGIEECRRVVENGELCWERLIRARGQRGLVVTYEELAESYQETVARVADFISPGIALSIPAPKTRRMSDDRSRELVERYRAERAAARAGKSMRESSHGSRRMPGQDELSVLQAALERTRAENARLKQAVAAQEATMGFLHQRHDTLRRIERGGWWRLRGRLGPILQLADRLRKLRPG